MDRKLIIALAISLAANVFVGGIFLGSTLRGAPPDPVSIEASPVGELRPQPVFRIVQQLPPESRRHFRRAFRNELPEMRDTNRELRRVRRELAIIVQAEEWDEAAVQEKFTEMRELRHEQAKRFESALIEALGELSREDRQRVLRAIGERERQRDQQGRMPRGE